jgi:hypothetical protein
MWDEEEEGSYWYTEERPYPSGPMCDICGDHEACAGSNGYNVCSEKCDMEARGRPAPGTEIDDGD